MKKALILHGWPQFDIKDHFLCDHLSKLGYKVTIPNLFSDNFVLSLDNISEKVEKRLRNNKPDLIVGISMGGLIVPHFAEEYSKAKLIFISTGPKLQTQSKGFLLTTKVAQFVLGCTLFSFLLKSPDYVFKFFYKLANPFKGEKKFRELYEKDTDTNIKAIKSISLSKEKEILDFVTQINNTNLLKKLKNKTLIFSGEKDLLMTKEGGEILHQLLRNSELVVNDGSHFNTFTENDLSKVDEFLQF